MDNKQMIGMGILMLEAIDAKNVEVVDIDRTEYDDGSVTYSVSVALPKPKVPTTGPNN